MSGFLASNVYGCYPQMPSAGVAAPTEQMGTSDLRSGARALIDPHNPLFWFGAILAVTFGLVGVAGSVRLGRAKISGSLDQA